MSDRFTIDRRAIQGRVGIRDTSRGNRLVCFFLADKDRAEAPAAMAQVCADALNATVSKHKGGSHGEPR